MDGVVTVILDTLKLHTDSLELLQIEVDKENLQRCLSVIFNAPSCFELQIDEKS